jgi:hypothetical protein
MHLAGGDHRQVIAAERRGLVPVRVEVGVGLSDQRVRGGAIGRGDGGVREGEAPEPILGEHEVRNGINDLAQEGSLGLERGVRLPTFLDRQ